MTRRNFMKSGALWVPAAGLLLPTPAKAAPIIRVGHTSHLATSSGLSITVSYAPTTGNAVFVGGEAWIGSQSPTLTTTVADTASNSYTLIKLQYDTAKTTSVLYRSYNVTGGSLTFTFTVTTAGSNVFLNIFVAEYSGLTNTDDGTAAGTGTGSPITVSSGITTTNANDLLLSMWAVGDANGTITITPTGGFAAVDSSLNGNVSAMGGLMEQIVSSTGTYIAGLTRSPAGAEHFSIVEGAFKGPAGGGSSGNGRQLMMGVGD